MPRKKKETADETEVTTSKKKQTAEPAADEAKDLLPKIQCFNGNKKLICANLQLDTHKCSAKSIAQGRPATVRIGKKRRCDMYEETAYSA